MTAAGRIDRVFRLRYTLHEPLFYAARELGTQYLTEPVLSSYAQPYALGWVSAPYRVAGEQVSRPAYAADLLPLAVRGIYVTPAEAEGRPRMHTERFNALGEGYRSRMDQGAVVDELSVLMVEGGKGRAVNRPQQGSIRFLGRGNVLQSFLIVRAGAEVPPLPAWVRLGKTLAKARLESEEAGVRGPCVGEFLSAAALNPVDLPAGLRPLRFDLVGVRPVPLLRAAMLAGEHLDTDAGCLPAGMAFRFPEPS